MTMVQEMREVGQTECVGRVKPVMETGKVDHQIVEPTLWLLHRATGIIVKGHRYGCVLTQKKGDKKSGTLVFRVSTGTGYRIYQMLQPSDGLSVGGDVESPELFGTTDVLVTYEYPDGVSYVEMYNEEGVEGMMTIVAGGRWETLCRDNVLRFEGIYA